MVLPSKGCKKGKNEKSQGCFCLRTFRNRIANEQLYRSLQNEKNLKMINKSQYYYTINGFPCLEIRVIIQPLPDFLFDNNILLFGSAGNGGPAFFKHKKPSRKGRAVCLLVFLSSSLHVVVNKPFNVV